MLIAIVLGIPLGLAAAVYCNGIVDYLTRLSRLAASPCRASFSAFSLQLMFVSWLDLPPLSGRFPADRDPLPKARQVSIRLIPYSPVTGTRCRSPCAPGALPAFAMSLSPLATIMRMMRASTIEVLQQDFVMTERALGISSRKDPVQVRPEERHDPDADRHWSLRLMVARRHGSGRNRVRLAGLSVFTPRRRSFRKISCP